MPANSRRSAGSAIPPYSRMSWRRSSFGWLLVAVVMPKCLFCLAGYLALTTGIATAAPELCGAAADDAAGSLGWWLVGPVVFVGVTFFRGRRARVSGSGRTVR